MFRRALHIVQVESLPFIFGQPGQQFRISHDRAQRCLEVMGNSKHQLFTGDKQIFRPLIRFFKLASITIAASDIPHDQNQKKSRQEYSTNSDACNDACRTHPHLLLKCRILTGTFSHFLLIPLNQAIHSCGQLCVHPLIPRTGTPDRSSPLQAFLFGSHANLMLKRIRRLNRFQNCIGSHFQRSVDQHGSIFFRRCEHFPQAFEKAFLFGGSYQRIAFGNDPMLYPLLGNHRILLFGDDFFNF